MSRMGVWVVVLLVAVVARPGVTAAQDIEPEAGAAVAEEAQPATEEAVDRSALTDPHEADLDARAAEVASGLRCPVCRNQSILESNAELSREMHRLVRDKLAAGETPEQVEAYFVSRYGEWILLQPKARGINLIVYGLPLVALILGFFLARNRLRKWASGSGVETIAGEAELGAEDEQWLSEALREG